MYEETKGKYIKVLEFILIDILMLEITLMLSYAIKYKIFNPDKHKIYLKVGLLIIGVSLIMVLLDKSYKNILGRGYITELKVTIIHVCYCTSLIAMGLLLTDTKIDMPVVLVIRFLLLGIMTLYTGRVALKYVIKRWVAPNKIKRHITILTTANELNSIINKINNTTYSNYRVNKLFILGEQQNKQEYGGMSISKYNIEIFQTYLKEEVVDEVLINLPSTIDVPIEVLTTCYQMGITVHMRLMSINYKMDSKVSEMFSGYPVLTCGMKIANPYQVLFKRSMDVIGGLVGVLLTGVLTCIIGPIIYFKDPGPIFFSQIRVGKNGRKFKIYKFRSMYIDAEDRKKELVGQNEMSGLMFKISKDPRILPVIGEKIRNWSLDEFPQFLNVLKGDMSLVGTRPPTLDEWEQYENHHYRRLATKPGLTGMWQVSGRSNITDFEEIVELDTKYITRWNIRLDIKILLKTVFVVFAKVGSR